jgi:hypothetical protein
MVYLFKVTSNKICEDLVCRHLPKFYFTGMSILIVSYAKGVVRFIYLVVPGKTVLTKSWLTILRDRWTSAFAGAGERTARVMILLVKMLWNHKHGDDSLAHPMEARWMGFHLKLIKAAAKARKATSYFNKWMSLPTGARVAPFRINNSRHSRDGAGKDGLTRKRCLSSSSITSPVLHKLMEAFALGRVCSAQVGGYQPTQRVKPKGMQAPHYVDQKRIHYICTSGCTQMI